MASMKKITKKIFKMEFKFYGIWIALILICILLALTTNTFFTYSNLVNVVRQVSVSVILACGMTIVIITGGIDLSVGAVLAFSSFIMADVLKSAGLVLALAAGLIVGAVLGFLLHRIRHTDPKRILQRRSRISKYIFLIVLVAKRAPRQQNTQYQHQAKYYYPRFFHCFHLHHQKRRSSARALRPYPKEWPQ